MRLIHLHPSGRLLAVAAAAALAVGAVCAQTSRSVQPSPRQAAPAAAATMGAPSANGLASPLPFPQGLPSPMPYPAGIPSSAIAAPGTPAAATGNTAQAQAAPLGIVAPAAAAAAAPAAQAVPPGGMGFGPGPYTAVQILQSFQMADSNRDGGLTRAEAQRLAIMPKAFEDMDLNKDGILSRSEYEDAVR